MTDLYTVHHCSHKANWKYCVFSDSVDKANIKQSLYNYDLNKLTKMLILATSLSVCLIFYGK